MQKWENKKQEEILNEIVKGSFGTHDGTFHSDEVTACALLIFFNMIRKALIFRTRDPNVLKRCEYVCDVGGVYDEKNKRFDHHQVEYRGSLSSAGMVLRYLRSVDVIGEDFFSYLNQSFIHGVDLHDTGQIELKNGIATFSEVISNFVPAEHDATIDAMDGAFYEALSFVIGHLDRLQKRFSYLQQTKEIVKEKMEKRDKYLLFERSIPWVDSFFELGGENHPALFVIMPTGDNWKLRSIPPTYSNRMAVRISHPKNWAGLRGEDLKEVSGIEGAIFCHKGGFISIWKSKEDALLAMKYIFKKEGIL